MPIIRRRRIPLILGVLALALVGGTLLYLRPTPELPLPAANQLPKPADPAQPPLEGATIASSASGAKPSIHVAAAARSWRPEERTAQKVAEVLADYPHLVAQANAGDTEAQLKLFSALHTCSQAALTPAALDDRIKDIATRIPIASPNYDVNVRSVTSEYQQCSQFDRPQIDEWRKWLSMAAATGDPQARRFYLSFGRPDDPKSDTYLKDTRDYNATAQEYLVDALAAGDANALVDTSSAYSSDPMGGGVGFDPDPIKQYAYFYAYCLATECRDRTLVQLQKLGAGLSPQDLSNATSQGQAIYKQCCAR